MFYVYWYNFDNLPEMYMYPLKTLFNIVEERLKKKLNFDVSAV